VDRAVLAYDEAPVQGTAPEGEASPAVILAFSPLADRDDGASLQFRAKGLDGEPEFARNEGRINNEVFAIARNTIVTHTSRLIANALARSRSQAA
jgi:hypothetical protein